MEQFFSKKLLQALEFASVAHRQQLRHGPGEIPYISHPAAVGMILWKAGYPEDVAMAGILHDVIEDTTFGYKDIAEKFGKKIADWVKEVSEDTSLPHDEKKEGYLAQLETASNEAKAISAADLLANRCEMLLDLQQGFQLWQKNPEKNIECDMRRIAIIKATINPPFLAELELVTKQAHEALKQVE